MFLKYFIISHLKIYYTGFVIVINLFFHYSARLAMEEGSDETRALKHRNVRRKLFVDDEESANSNHQRGAIDNEANYFVESAKENLEKVIHFINI